MKKSIPPRSSFTWPWVVLLFLTSILFGWSTFHITSMLCPPPIQRGDVWGYVIPSVNPFREPTTNSVTILGYKDKWVHYLDGGGDAYLPEKSFRDQWSLHLRGQLGTNYVTNVIVIVQPPAGVTNIISSRIYWNYLK